MFDIDHEISQNSSENFTQQENQILEKLKIEWSSRFRNDKEVFLQFLNPFIITGLPVEQISFLLKKIPIGWNLDHKEMYFDFRLSRWIKHIEPKNLRDTVKEYLENSDTLEEGVLYVQKILAVLSKKMTH